MPSHRYHVVLDITTRLIVSILLVHSYNDPALAAMCCCPSSLHRHLGRINGCPGVVMLMMVGHWLLARAHFMQGLVVVERVDLLGVVGVPPACCLSDSGSLDVPGWKAPTGYSTPSMPLHRGL